MNEVVLDGSAPAGNSEPANPAAAQPNAATTDPATGAGEGGDEGQGTPKTFTQQELDDIVKKRVAKAEDRAERRVLRTLEKLTPHQQSQQQPHQAQAPEEQRPTRRQGETDDAYFDRLTDWKLEQRDRKAEQSTQQQQAQSLAKKTESIYADAEKLQGFDRDAFDELPLTKPIVEALIDSDAAAKLMHYMAANPAEVERIAKLSPARQAAEIGKLETKVAAAPPKTSNAPAPHRPVGSGNGSGSHNPEDMSFTDYEKWREKQRRA